MQRENCTQKKSYQSVNKKKWNYKKNNCELKKNSKNL